MSSEILGLQGVQLKAAMDAATARHRVIARNVANLNTPGYRAQDLSFDRVLGELTITDREGVVPREDGNTVVLEVEVAEMKKNSLAFRTYLMALSHRIRQTRSAITGQTG